MNRSVKFCLAAMIGLSVAAPAFGWGTVTGPNGGAAYRGPRGAAIRGPNGGAAVRGPYGGAAVRGPYGGAAVRGPYGGAAVRTPYGATAVRPAYRGGVYVRPWAPLPYYGAVVAGVTIGTIIAASAVPPAPSTQVCWYWTSAAHTQGYWDYCGP